MALNDGDVIFSFHVVLSVSIMIADKIVSILRWGGVGVKRVFWVIGWDGGCVSGAGRTGYVRFFVGKRWILLRE